MKAFREGDLEIEFPDQAHHRRFDDPSTHKLTHCMKAVDCIFEWNGDTYFLEIKDPEHPKSQVDIKKYLSDSLDNDLKYKYRDSFLYEYASGKGTGKLHYIVLLCMRNLDSSMLMRRSETLRKAIPMEGPSRSWQKAFITSCTVLNLDAWKRFLGQFPVRRLSETHPI
jgi:hypothetical protein